MRALPLCGKSAFNSSADSALRFSTALIARAKARASPARNRSIQGWRLGFKLFSVKQPRRDGKRAKKVGPAARRQSIGHPALCGFILMPYTLQLWETILTTQGEPC